MEEILTRYWWAVLVRGLVAIGFGAIALLYPGLTLTALILLFGALAFVDGVFSLIAAISGLRRHRGWRLQLLRGVLGIAVGVVTLWSPGLTALALVLYIAAWALVSGVFEIVTAIRLRKTIEGEWLLALSGIASIVFGGLVLWAPGAGALALLLWIAAWTLAIGVLLVVLSFRLRARRHSTAADVAPAGAPRTARP